MNGLPDLPFEKVLSDLTLEELLKARLVSREWYQRINCYRVHCLCFSQHPIGSIYGKRQLVTGAFLQNFIQSNRFASFFSTFGPTILSNLRHLRLCQLKLDEENRAAFASALNSFTQLKYLDIIQLDVGCWTMSSFSKLVVELHLPMLQSIHLEEVHGIERMTLNAPRLKRIKITHCSDLEIRLVHAESIEWFLVDWLKHISVNELRNVQYFYSADKTEMAINPTLLTGLMHLNEIHLDHCIFPGPFQLHKIAQYLAPQPGRTDPKLYVWGRLLNGPTDPALASLLRDFDGKVLRCLAKSHTRLADQIPFYDCLQYTTIERVSREQFDFELPLKKLVDLKKIFVDRPVQNVDHFLHVLKTADHIEELWFRHAQPQKLYDRLPEHCSVVQRLIIERTASDYRFLFGLKDLIQLDISSIDTATVRQLFYELKFLSKICFRYQNKLSVSIETCGSKQFQVSVNRKSLNATDLNSVIQFILSTALELATS